MLRLDTASAENCEQSLRGDDFATVNFGFEMWRDGARRQMDGDVLLLAKCAGVTWRQIISMLGGAGEPGAPSLAYRCCDCILSHAPPATIGQYPTSVTLISLPHTGRSGLCNTASKQHDFNFNQHTRSRPHRVSAAEVTALTILVASFGLAWLASVFGLNHGTTVSVTRLSIEIIAVCAALGAMATFVDFLIGSREEKVASATARMKRAQPRLWIARLAYTTIFAGIWCALSTHLCLEMLVQYCPGNTYSIQGMIVSTSVNHGGFVCKDDATVRFDEGGRRNTLTLCYVSGFLSTRPMAQGRIEPGAMVNVLFVRNALGVAMVEMTRINK